MPSLLEIVRAVADEVGLPRPSAVASSTEQLARQFFGLANAELVTLGRVKPWPILVRTASLPTVANQNVYDLPADYRSLIGDTVFNASSYYQLRGSVSPAEWEYTKSLNLGTLSRAKMRIVGGKLYILPTPVSVENLAYEYLSKNYVLAGATPAERFAQDTDVPVVDSELLRMGIKWRIKHAKGLDFGADLADYNSEVSREFAVQLAAPSIQIGGSRYSGSPEITEGYMRENGFGS